MVSFESKTIQFNGQSFELAGLADDVYFQHLDAAHAANLPLCEIIWNELKPNSVIFDVGANIGLTTLLFSRVVNQSVVYSFEPGAKAFSCLSETLRKNNMSLARAFNFGLSDKSRELKFFEAGMLAGSYAVTKEHPFQGIANTRIEVMSIDDFVRERKIGNRLHQD